MFPGDPLSLRGSVVRLGPGLLQSGQQVVASRAGRLKQGSNAKLWVDNAQKRVTAHTAALTLTITAHSAALLTSVPLCRCGSPAVQYLPVAEDLVIGIVAEKHAENYKLDIGGPEVTQPCASARPWKH